MKIVPADFNDPRLVALVSAHAARARAETAPGSAHALDLDALRGRDIDFWALWAGQALLGTGALKTLSADHGEVKSMYTDPARRRSGAGAAILADIIAAARAKGLTRLSLETGSWPYFAPARAFYAKHGFERCAPFGDYKDDPNSVFMTRAI